MSEEIKLNEPLPDDVIHAVRDAYAPPGGESYWSVLESRIMAGLGKPARWWMVVGEWAHGSLLAAAAALVATAVGLLLVQAHQREMRLAYDAATRPAIVDSVSIPTGALSERDGPDTRGATFRDVISH